MERGAVVDIIERHEKATTKAVLTVAEHSGIAPSELWRMDIVDFHTLISIIETRHKDGGA